MVCKPYVYRITFLEHTEGPKHYYGARYCKTSKRFSSDPLEDLKNYKTSSSDHIFKEMLHTHPEKFKFKIVKICDSKAEALRTEINIHQKFNVGGNPLFFNKVSAGSVGILKTTSNTPHELYDVQTESYVILSRDELSIMLGIPLKYIPRLIYDRPRIILNRFCTMGVNHQDVVSKWKYNNVEITLYSYCFKTESVMEHTFIRKDGPSIVGRDFSTLSKVGHANGFYTTREYCERDNKVIHLYKCIEGTVKEIQIRSFEGNKVVGDEFQSFFTRNSKYVGEYYLDRDLCVLHNTAITVYNFMDEYPNIIIRNGTYKEHLKIMGGRFSSVYKGYMNSTNGWYTDMVKGLQDHEQYVLYKYNTVTNTINSLKIFRKEFYKVAGAGFENMKQGERRKCRGYYLSHKFCEVDNII